MNIRSIPITEIQRAKYNPRKALKPGDPAYEKLKKAVNTFGLVEPLVWNSRSGNLVGGHQRLSIVEERGDIEVEVSVVDLDQRDEKALNLALNKHSGEWDFVSLADVLLDLDAGDLDMDITGFGAEDLERIMTWTPPNADKDEDAVPDEPVEPITKPGNLWMLGKHRLLCGDSTKPTDVAALMGKKRADMVFTSPPYAQQREYGKAMDQVQDWDALMQGVFAILPIQTNAQILVNLGLVHRDNEVVPYWDNWIAWMREAGYRRFGWYVWDQGPGLPGNWNGRLAPSHEFVFHFNTKSIQPNKCIEKKPASVGMSTGSGLRSKNGKLGRKVSPAAGLQPTKIPDSVIRINRQGTEHLGHPAGFPVALPKAFLVSYIKQKESVYDPFVGSGTTIIAAEATNRICYAMELEPAYVDIAVKRWETFTGNKAELAK